MCTAHRRGAESAKAMDVIPMLPATLIHRKGRKERKGEAEHDNELHTNSQRTLI